MTSYYPDQQPGFDPSRSPRPVTEWAEAGGVPDPFGSGQPPMTHPYAPVPRSIDLYRNHQGLAIFATFMCLPVGIFAIYLSGQISRLRAMGDSVGAIEASNRTRLLSLVGIGVGSMFWIIVLLLGCSAAMTSYQYSY